MTTNETTPEPSEGIPKKGLRKVRGWGLWINLATFLIGYATGVIAGALLYIRDDMELSSGEQGIVTSILLLGAMAGAMSTGRLAEQFGRKKMLLTAGVLFAIGFAIAALAQGFWLLFFGRLLMGLGVGVGSALVPTYLGEISPAQIRGWMLTLNQLMQTVGMLVAYVVNLIFAANADWRAMFWVGAVPAVVLALIAMRLPESPAWLVAKGRTDAAKKMLSKVTDDEGAEEVVARYQQEERERQEQLERKQGKGAEEKTGWRALITRRVRPGLVVAVGLAVLQQFVGINTVLYFAPTIMEQTGLSAANSIVYSVIIGGVNLGMTIVSLWLIDRAGRRPLLLVSLVGMGISVAVLGLAFLADLSPVVMLICMLVYVSSFAVGMGPVFWVILGEVFPSDQQAEGSGAGSATSWLSNFAVSTAFLPVVGVIGTGWVFLIFAVICLIALIFVYRRVPETKGRDFDEIEPDLQARAYGSKTAA